MKKLINNMAHAGGRPSDYRPEYIKKVNEYLDGCGTHNMKLPKRVDVALLLDCDEKTLAKWGEDHPEFLRTLMRVDMTQKSQLMNDGMYGGKDINANIARFLMNVNHGMIETNREVVAGDESSPLRIDVGSAIERIYGADQLKSGSIK